MHGFFHRWRLDAHDQLLGVPTEFFEANGVQIPWLDPYKMVEWLSENDKLHFLHGNANLSIFWRRFAAQEPDHPVFAAGCSLPFSRVIPFLAHGDEGRTKKKKGIMLWSMHGIVGSGTRFFKQKTAEEQMSAMGLNLDNSFCSRFLHAAVPNKLYKENEPLWHELAEKIGSAYFRLQTTGFQHKGKTWFAACVGLTGDAPFLSKAGCLQRSFARVPKKPRDAGSGRPQKEPAGICFLCLAGKTRVPFEDLGKSPKWLQSMAEAPLPWIGCPPLLRGLRESRPHFLKYDIWHNFHGGLGKNFIASCVAEILPAMRSGTSIDEKLNMLQMHYDHWKRHSGLRLHYSKIDRDTFGLTSLQVWPTAAWNKFADTRVFFAWLETYLQTDDYVPSEITTNIHTALAAANRCFALLFRSGVWLDRQEAKTAGSEGLLFLHKYAVLAHQTLVASRPRFSLTPKAHFLHHSFMDIFQRADHQDYTLSPLAHSVQIDEDMVGRVSRLSRKVGSILQMQRTLDRYKAAARLAMEQL